MPTRFSLPRLRSSSKGAKRPAGSSGAKPSQSTSSSMGVDVRTAAPGRRTRAQAEPSPGRDGGPPPSGASRSSATRTTQQTASTSASTKEVQYAMATPSPRPAPPRRDNSSASGGSGSSGLSDDEFMSAFNRSPPSFDEMVVDEAGGVFPRFNPPEGGARPSHDRSDGGGDGFGTTPDFGHVVSPEGGNDGTREASGWDARPSQNGWGDGGSAADRSASDLGSPISKSGPYGQDFVDSPVLDGDPTADSDPATDSPSEDAFGTAKDDEDGWFTSFGGFGTEGDASTSPSNPPSAKTRRLVSPDHSPEDKGRGGGLEGPAWGEDDDGGAWGEVVGRSLYSGADQSKQNSGGGFGDFSAFGDDGFGPAGDDGGAFPAAVVEDGSFFGTPWGVDADAAPDGKSSDPWGGAGFDGPAPDAAPESEESKSSDPWGAAFGSDPFAAGDASKQTADSGERTAESEGGSLKANGRRDAEGREPSPVQETPAPREVRQSSLEPAEQVWGQAGGTSAHPLRSGSHAKAHIDAAANEFGRGASNGSSRRGVPPAGGGHRRDPSGASQCPADAPPRRTRGGSVGSNRSNSSAVDSILEHYRQKRRQKHAGASTSGSVHSGPHPADATPGSNGSSTGERTGGSNGHRRVPSGESIDRAISALQTAASTESKSSNPGGYRLTPSPATRYQMPPPAANGADGGPGCASDEADRFLFANIRATLGGQGAAPDLESLGGRSGRSGRSPPGQHPGVVPGARTSRARRGNGRRSPGRSRRKGSGSASVASSHSHRSFRTYASNRSQLSRMSRESQGVANDLFRLEAQLAEQVARQERNEAELLGGPSSEGREVLAAVSSGSAAEEDHDDGDGGPVLGAEAAPRPSPVRVVAPPGKLGILLANRAGRRGPSHVSAVRGGSVLAGRVRVGDVLTHVDGADVTGMSSREITGVVGRRRDEERVLTFLPVVEKGASDEWV